MVAASALGVFGPNTVALRAIAIYGFLLVVFRLTGKRTVAQLTSFDLVVLLIIGDDIEDVLEAAREQEGIETIDQVEFAVLERHGGVSIIPKRR